MSVVAVALLGMAGVPAEASPAAATTAAATSRFVPVHPARLLDTRIGLGAAAVPVPAGGEVVLQVTGNTLIPPEAIAAALTITATDTTAPGYVTVWPADQARPLASTLNVHVAGETVPNLAIVPLGRGGQVRLFTQEQAHLIVDVSGYWVSATVSRGGRLQVVGPRRVLDTRIGLGVAAGALPPDGQLELRLGGVEVPADATAAVMNLTATEAAAPGYVTAWPTGGPRPHASNLNLSWAGATAANLVVVPLGRDGSVSFYAQSGTHLVADLAGWFTSEADPFDDQGLLVSLPPTRVFDSRDGIFATGQRTLPADRRYDVPLAGMTGIPCTSSGAVIVNVTGTEAAEPGYVTAWPAATHDSGTSVLNLAEPGHTRANLAIAPLGLWGQLSVRSQHPAALVLDVSGYFTGTARRPEHGVTATPDHRADEGLPTAPPCYANPLDGAPMPLPPRDIYDCDDFLFRDSAEELQRRWGDMFGFDPDGNGIVCDELPPLPGRCAAPLGGEHRA